LSRAAREALVLAEGKADKLGHRYIRNEHLLLGLVESESNYAAQLLRQKDISAEKLRLQIKALPQTKEVHEPTRKSKQSQAEGELIRRVGERVGRGEGQTLCKCWRITWQSQDRTVSSGCVRWPLCRCHGFTDWGSQNSTTLVRGTPSLHSGGPNGRSTLWPIASLGRAKR
jgi:ClpA/ClpB-like protein